MQHDFHVYCSDVLQLIPCHSDGGSRMVGKCSQSVLDSCLSFAKECLYNATAAACSHSKSWWLVVSIHYQLVMSCTLVIFKQGHESWWQSFSTTVVVLHKECKLQTHTYNHIQYICNISLGTPGSKEIKFDKLNGPPAYAFSKSKEQQLEYWRGIRWLDEAKRQNDTFTKTKVWEKGASQGSNSTNLTPTEQVAGTNCQVWDCWPDFEVGW